MLLNLSMQSGVSGYISDVSEKKNIKLYFMHFILTLEYTAAFHVGLKEKRGEF